MKLNKSMLNNKLTIDITAALESIPSLVKLIYSGFSTASMP